MPFHVTYWQPAQYSMPAADDEVILALTEYINADKALGQHILRAEKMRQALADGAPPDDLEIIAIVLQEGGWTAADDAKPDTVDEAMDYTVEWRAL